MGVMPGGPPRDAHLMGHGTPAQVEGRACPAAVTGSMARDRRGGVARVQVVEQHQGESLAAPAPMTSWSMLLRGSRAMGRCRMRHVLVAGVV